jgi:opacity protein-like surface antigen
MNRPLVAALALSTILSIDSTLASAGSGAGYPASVLRLRGGIAFPDPDHHDPGAAWSAGGAAGVVLNRNILLSLCYDHIDLDDPGAGFRSPAVDPVTLEIELGRPMAHGITPRIAAGGGPYFRRHRFQPSYALDAGSQTRSSLGAANFGMHFGAGVSLPLTKRTMMDFDFRYHQTVGREQALVVGNTTVGLRFLFPGGSDPDGYVRNSSKPEAVALR